MIAEEHSDSEIRVLGVEAVQDGHGRIMNVALVESDGDQALLVDVDNDGTIDVLLHDDNHDGNLQQSEIHDISGTGLDVADLCLNDDSYLAAHIGDSRICHIRPSSFNPKEKRGGIIYQSSDHSLVNDLLKAGEITEQEALEFPARNVITRAMQPYLDVRYKADVYLLDDIE